MAVNLVNKDQVELTRSRVFDDGRVCYEYNVPAADSHITDELTTFCFYKTVHHVYSAACRNFGESRLCAMSHFEVES